MTTHFPIIQYNNKISREGLANELTSPLEYLPHVIDMLNYEPKFDS